MRLRYEGRDDKWGQRTSERDGRRGQLGWGGSGWWAVLGRSAKGGNGEGKRSSFRTPPDGASPPVALPLSSLLLARGPAALPLSSRVVSLRVVECGLEAGQQRFASWRRGSEAARHRCAHT